MTRFKTLAVGLALGIAALTAQAPAAQASLIQDIVIKDFDNLVTFGTGFIEFDSETGNSTNIIDLDISGIVDGVPYAFTEANVFGNPHGAYTITNWDLDVTTTLFITGEVAPDLFLTLQIVGPLAGADDSLIQCVDMVLGGRCTSGDQATLQARVTATPRHIAEPGMAGILGLGLAGLVLMRRKRMI